MKEKYCSYCGSKMVKKINGRYNQETGQQVTFLECPNYKPRRLIKILFRTQEFHDTDDVDKWDI